MAMQLTELAKQLVTIRHNLDPKHGDIPDADELEATRLALSQLSDHANAFMNTQTSRLIRGILPLLTEKTELLRELIEYWQRILADPGRPGGHAINLGALKDALPKLEEKVDEFESRLTEYNTLCDEYDRFGTELRGALEQPEHQAHQLRNAL
ncbi:hypothetical protein ARSEF1564_000148 [Beauveria bassiana]